MAKINLLPWREDLRQQKQKDFVSAICAGVLVTGLLFSLVYIYIEDLKEHQQRRNTMLDKQIKLVDIKIEKVKEIEEKKNKLLTKIEVIQTLQESRPQIVHLFDELPKRTPNGIFLSKFTQKGKVLDFVGVAQSNARVSAYMRGIEASAWLESPVLEVIKVEGKASEAKLNNFTMHAKQGENKVKGSEGDE